MCDGHQIRRATRWLLSCRIAAKNRCFIALSGAIVNTDRPFRQERRAFTFECRGVDTRHEMVLRSLLRVIDGRLHQTWTATSVEGDLLLRSEDNRLAIEPLGRGLYAGIGDQSRVLAFPFNYHKLEAALNELGDMLEQTLPDAASQRIDRHALTSRSFRLRHWPEVALLDTRVRMRLSAALLRADLTAAELVRMTGCAMHECRQLLADLHVAGLLATAPAGAGRPEVRQPFLSTLGPRERMGVIGRIRARLGI
jgi:hypothetical protein